MEVPALLTDLFKSCRAVDFALAFIVLEFGFLLWRAPKADLIRAAFNLILALGPGACLMLAVRCALTQTGTQTGVVWVAFWLAMSLPLHLADIVRRKL
jgi:hypothetical protein